MPSSPWALKLLGFLQGDLHLFLFSLVFWFIYIHLRAKFIQIGGESFSGLFHLLQKIDLKLE